MQGNCFQNVTLSLIDFGFATRHTDRRTGRHIKKGLVDYFRGNLLFSSKHQLQFFDTSRRDDIISVFYILVYLINQGDMPGLDWKIAASMNGQERHELVKDLKMKNPLNFWCQGPSKDLMHFANEVEELRFSTRPNYGKLRILLQVLIQEE